MKSFFFICSLFISSIAFGAQNINIEEMKEHVRPYTRLVTDVMETYTGSAFELELNGKVYTVTNRHLCNNQHFLVSINDQNGRLSLIKVIALSSSNDLCILEGDSDIGLKVAETLEMNQHIFIFGHPRGEPLTATEGNTIKPEIVTINNVPFEAISTTVPIDYGNSGSPVLNEKYEVVGVFFGLYPEEKHAYNVPLKNLKHSLDKFLETL